MYPMDSPPPPFEPLRRTLYSPDEMLAGLDLADPASLADTLDFRIYRHWVMHGRAKPGDRFIAMMQVLHDHAITLAVAEVIESRPVVAIMGGHGMVRGTPPYRAVAELARTLARSGCLVASGGGPGAMEATHLGALHALEPDGALDAAHATLARETPFPRNAGRLVSESGAVDAAVLDALFRWLLPALEVRSRVKAPTISLGVPTWQYGHEPTTPFATHLAKYFQNSVREEGLLTIATHGIAYAPGRAGTLQEIFQDAALNAYEGPRAASPMVFLGRDYWTATFPVTPVLRALFGEELYARFVLLTDHVAEAAAFILDFVPTKAPDIVALKIADE